MWLAYWVPAHLNWSHYCSFRWWEKPYSWIWSLHLRIFFCILQRLMQFYQSVKIWVHDTFLPPKFYFHSSLSEAYRCLWKGDHFLHLLYVGYEFLWSVWTEEGRFGGVRIDGSEAVRMTIFKVAKDRLQTTADQNTDELFSWLQTVHSAQYIKEYLSSQNWWVPQSPKIWWLDNIVANQIFILLWWPHKNNS